MADTPVTLGQVTSVVATAVKLATGAANGSIGRITANNRPSSAGVANVGIEVRIAGAATTPADFRWEQSVAQGVPANFGPLALGATDEVWVTADILLVNFNMDGFNL